MNIFKNMRGRVENSPWAIVIFVMAVYLLYVAANLWIEDYATTRAFYASMPTHKVYGDRIVSLAAQLPQLLPIFFGYIFATDTKKRGWGLVALAIMLLDMTTDVLYKSSGLSMKWVFGAIVESLFLYTIGSEVLIIASFGTIMTLFRPAIRMTGRLMANSVTVLEEIFDEFRSEATDHPAPKSSTQVYNHPAPPPLDNDRMLEKIRAMQKETPNAKGESFRQP